MLVLNPSGNIFKSQQSLPKEYPIELTYSTKVCFPQQANEKTAGGRGEMPLSTGSRVCLPRLPPVAMVTGLDDTLVLLGSQRYWGETAFCNKATRNKFLLLKSTDTRPTPCRASLVAHLVKSLPTMQETWVRSLGWEDPLEKGKATHSTILPWRIPWTV